ncbi:MAG: hypothetical protein EXR66_04155 [Dehalococcoidia bacterium]|nr:hypothetical protein [Dehalococcoidia bacterium]
MTREPEDGEEGGSEVRTCASCGHSEAEHRATSDEAERGRVELCLTCGDRHTFAPLVEIGER